MHLLKKRQEKNLIYVKKNISISFAERERERKRKVKVKRGYSRDKLGGLTRRVQRDESSRIVAIEEIDLEAPDLFETMQPTPTWFSYRVDEQRGVWLSLFPDSINLQSRVATRDERNRTRMRNKDAKRKKEREARRLERQASNRIEMFCLDFARTCIE